MSRIPYSHSILYLYNNPFKYPVSLKPFSPTFPVPISTKMASNTMLSVHLQEDLKWNAHVENITKLITPTRGYSIYVNAERLSYLCRWGLQCTAQE